MLALLSSSGFISSGGYAAIFLLCVLQSCGVPTSSELTMGFAGVLAARGQLNLAAAIAVGASGEIIGAYIAWFIGKVGGRALIGRYGRYVLLTRTDVDRAEAWYGRHRRGGVFVGRLLPVIRGYVALAAGVAEVPLVPFGIFTAAGSIVWDSAMAGIGYGVGSNYNSVLKVFSDAGYLLGAAVVVLLVFAVRHRLQSFRRTREKERQEDALAAEGAPGAAAPVDPPPGRGRHFRS